MTPKRIQRKRVAICCTRSNGLVREWTECLWRGRWWAATRSVPPHRGWSVTHLRTGAAAFDSNYRKGNNKHNALAAAKRYDEELGEPFPRARFKDLPSANPVLRAKAGSILDECGIVRRYA